MRRVLIANRGEIAVRVIRTCRAMGLRTVAVYSEADAQAPHVAAADEAVAIGPAPAVESYLDSRRILDAARRTQADAIHPGYGFLSENADFAAACAEAGVTFVGPPADVIRRSGSKTAAREAVAAAGVPVVPGRTPRSQTSPDIAEAVRAVGLPALLKATAGGGGKGMRIVRTAAEIEESVEAARGEARRAFANGDLYVERLIDRPRHIEVQVLGDEHGALVHLFERDCTLQRRHQKVIEEAPARGLHPDVRARLTESAVRAAKAVGYVNAGTVEFLVQGDGPTAEFYFLEMNTRLQVEHPITEAITGLDLVRLQLQIAAGDPIPFRQQDVTISGHAIEGRVYAEDARMLPQSGRLLRYREPVGDGIRVDGGVAEGQTITVHYDPLLAKLIAHAPTAEDARARLLGAIAQYEILGVQHNLGVLAAIIGHPDVQAGRTHTRFIEDHLDQITRSPDEAISRAAAAIAAFVASRDANHSRAVSDASVDSGEAVDTAKLDPWDTLGPLPW